MIRAAVCVLALVGCATERTLEIVLQLGSSCTCEPSEISLDVGATVAFVAQEGTTTLFSQCTSFEPVPSNVEDVVLGTLFPLSSQIEPIDAGTQVGFTLNVARPASSVACDPDAPLAAPLILQARTTLLLDPSIPLLPLVLECLDACP